MKKTVSAFLCLVLLFSFASCAKSAAASGQTDAGIFIAEPKPGSGKIVYLVLEKEGAGEGTTGGALLAALDGFAAETELTYYVQETAKIDEYTEYLLTIASGGGTDIVIGIGEYMVLPIREAATQYPDQRFLLVGGSTSVNRKNVAETTPEGFCDTLLAMLEGTL